MCVCVCVCDDESSVRGVHERAGPHFSGGAFEPIQWWAMLYGDTVYTSTWMELRGHLYRFERVKDQHARGARGAGARCQKRFAECVRSEVTALHVCGHQPPLSGPDDPQDR